ncbi:Rubrerythrin [bioreactor metagenome]|uniref:Rubrerythrin n=1 Tax=bioreactor metagenome TaxID=1076179 RepID=A0A644YK67_9ZZZZ|nr:rubrerythrin family protein [Oscillibacter sp.]
MELKGTMTEKNLKAAFTGESMARNRYTFYAEKAKQEGLDEIADLYERMAKNETIHAKLFYQHLNGGIPATAANLMESMKGEFGEWSSLYPGFAKTAREEGLSDVAELFEKIADIECNHEHAFLAALAKLSATSGKPAAAEAPETQPKTVTVNGYRCMFCGATYEKRPDVCSVCHAIGSFETASFQKEI